MYSQKKKKKNAASKTVKVEQTKTTVANYCNFSHLLFIYIYIYIEIYAALAI